MLRLYGGPNCNNYKFGTFSIKYAVKFKFISNFLFSNCLLTIFKFRLTTAKVSHVSVSEWRFCSNLGANIRPIRVRITQRLKAGDPPGHQNRGEPLLATESIVPHAPVLAGPGCLSRTSSCRSRKT